jgi:hypothetical protein
VHVRATTSKYELRDQYNADETGIMWKLVPDSTLSARPVKGVKVQKERITAHFACNADGSDKLPIWIIGQAANPRCFRAAKANINSLGVEYRYNGTAWMNEIIFEEWLRWFDRRMAGR